MGILGKKLRGLQGGMVGFICIGCNEMHAIIVAGPEDSDGAAGWIYNQNPDAPTFKPSILIKSGHYATHYKTGSPCWCTKKDGGLWPFKCTICHFFVTDGKIRYLDDCTHDLAGKTVELPDIENLYPPRGQDK